MNFESQEMGKRARAGRILNWEDLPTGEFKVRRAQEVIGLYREKMILTLERNGETIKVWACGEMMYEMERMPRRKWRDLKVVIYGVKMCESGRYRRFEFEMIT